MANATQNLPRQHQIAIGRAPGDSGSLIGIVERLSSTTPADSLPPQQTIHALVENFSPDTPFTLTCRFGRPAFGSVTLSGVPDDADEVVLDDGVNSAVTFEFDNDGSVTESATLRAVNFTSTDGPHDLAHALAAAITAAPALDITAYAVFGPTSGDVRVDLLNDTPGTQGNVAITNTDVATVQTLTGMASGTGATSAHNLRLNGSDVGSIVVAAGARVEFGLEIALADTGKEFLSFYGTAGDEQFGALTLSYWEGELVRRERWSLV